MYGTEVALQAAPGSRCRVACAPAASPAQSPAGASLARSPVGPGLRNAPEIAISTTA